MNSYENVHQFIQKALDVFKLRSYFNPGEEVIIKPNFIKYNNPQKGCITHPEVVKSVINLIRFDYAPVITEGSLRKGDADKCFSAFGLRDLAPCINLDKDKFVKVKVKGKILNEVNIAQTALKAINAPFISLPKLKIHGIAGTTIGIKNNMGFLKKPAVNMHFRIHHKLVDLLKLFQPAITIIDGVIGGNVSELYTTPVEHGVMVASDNVIAADAVGSYLMGFDPLDMGYLRIAFEEFDIKWEDINIECSHKIDDLRKDYSLSLWSRALGSMRIG